MTKERINHLRELSKRDDEIIVGSDIRELCAHIDTLEARVAELEGRSWRPIDTMSDDIKNGRGVQLLFNGFSYPCRLSLDNDDEEVWELILSEPKVEFEPDIHFDLNAAKFWRPLPTPPTEQAPEEV